MHDNDHYLLHHDTDHDLLYDDDHDLLCGDHHYLLHHENIYNIYNDDSAVDGNSCDPKSSRGKTPPCQLALQGGSDQMIRYLDNDDALRVIMSTVAIEYLHLHLH